MANYRSTEPVLKDTTEEQSIDEIIKATDGVLTEEQQAIIEEFDREQKVRKFSSKVVEKIYYYFALFVALYHLYTCAFGGPATLIHRSIHVATMLAMGFMLYPMHKKAGFKKIPWYDWLFIALSASVAAYMWGNYLGVVQTAGNPTLVDTIFATILVVMVLECTRRVSGWPLVILSLVFIAYALFGRDIPGMFRHRGYTWAQLANHLFANTEGIYGTSVDVAASYIFLFILFGAFMNKSGMGQFFNDIALALAGGTRGGPAKVSVVASAMLGSINGSAVANVVTTGAFTIPLMQRTGYSSEFAGAVEAAASVGGQILPPVMGAAAFIMAEMLGMKYTEIAVAAAIPAIMYYLGVVLQVHYRACRLGLKGVSKENLPQVWAVLKARGHLCIPIIFLLFMLFFSGTTIIYAAFCSIIVTILCAQLRKETRMSIRDITDALVAGTKETTGVAMACACVGIVVGVISKTGFGLNMASAILQLGGKSLLLTLLFTMVTCMILGMGVPSIPAYIITSSIAAPALAELGIPLLASHMFVFYFGMFANLTPPVALAAFAAAGLSGGSPMKTGWQSVKLALAGFIVPYMFVYSKELLLIDTTFATGARVALGAFLGVFLIASAVEGWILTKMPTFFRVLAMVGALLLIDSGLVTDVLGFAILAACIIQQKIAAKKEAGAAAAS